MVTTPFDMISRPFPPRRRASTGFTLVEVALTIGIVSFALLSCVGLNAVSLGSFTDARAVDVSSRIFRSVLNEAQISDYSSIPTGTRFYDSEGFLLNDSDPKGVYRALIRLTTSSVGDFDFSDATAKSLVVEVYRVGGTNLPVSRRCAMVGNRTKSN